MQQIACPQAKVMSQETLQEKENLGSHCHSDRLPVFFCFTKRVGVLGKVPKCLGITQLSSLSSLTIWRMRWFTKTMATKYILSHKTGKVSWRHLN